MATTVLGKEESGDMYSSKVVWEKYLPAIETDSFKKKLTETIEQIECFLEITKNPYFAFSGGKDSTVCAHIIAQTCPNIPVFSQCDDLDWPDKESHIEKILKLVGLENYELIYPNESARRTYRQALNQGTVTDEMCIYCFENVINDYNKKYNRDGVILGLRTEEARGRKANFESRGFIYKRTNNQWVCQPIAKWKGYEIIGYLVVNKLPLHSIYEKLGEFLGPENVRFGWPIHPKYTRFGTATYIRILYPDYWQKLTSEFPELQAIS
jgi:3'-phosphoadenosine 5'-phosphosulfate sulfotransferase (PAPS reductase)/FAD synthetase